MRNCPKIKRPFRVALSLPREARHASRVYDVTARDGADAIATAKVVAEGEFGRLAYRAFGKAEARAHA